MWLISLQLQKKTKKNKEKLEQMLPLITLLVYKHMYLVESTLSST